MIKSIRHRGLKRLFEREDRGLIRPDLVDTVENILFVLDEATSVQALAIPATACIRSKENSRATGR